MEYLKNIGLAAFLFFLIKGLLWITLFALLYYKVISKETLKKKRFFRIFFKQ